MFKRNFAAALLQSVGLAAGVMAGWSVSATIGLIVLSVALIVVGVALERGR